jgi:hypothetical protein
MSERDSSRFLSGDTPAPTIDQILSCEEDMRYRDQYPFFGLRSSLLETGLQESYQDGNYTKITATTEAKAIEDFRTRMEGLAQFFEENGGQGDAPLRALQAQILGTELRFIGHGEFMQGIESLAQHWLQKLQLSETGELAVVVEEDSSSAYVYTRVIERLQELDIDAADNVLAFSANLNPRGLAELADRFGSSGVILVDDWVISGQQIQENESVLKDFFDPEKIEINLICATDKFLSEGDSRGLPRLSQYVRPYTEPMGTAQPSITGSHCHTDFGFSNEIRNLYGYLRPETIRHNPYPLLYRVARVYNRSEMSMPGSRSAELTPDQREELARRQERCAVLAGRILDNMTSPSQMLIGDKPEVTHHSTAFNAGHSAIPVGEKTFLHFETAEMDKEELSSDLLKEVDNFEPVFQIPTSFHTYPLSPTMNQMYLFPEPVDSIKDFESIIPTQY